MSETNSHTTTTTPVQADFRVDSAARIIHCSGAWIMQNASQLAALISAVSWPKVSSLTTNVSSVTQLDKVLSLTIDVSGVTQLDTAGVWLLNKIEQQLREKKITVTFQGLKAEHTALFEFIKDKGKTAATPTVIKPKSVFYQIGVAVWQHGQEAISLFSFIGELAIFTVDSFRRTSWLQIKALLSTIERAGFGAVPIVGLLSFLIGVVMAYQIGVELISYGANVYIVNLLGISIFREFGPLITAIIIAGRSGSAFTAEIGTMKVNEEIDALRTMSLIPSELLVLPKIAGLVIALPLLTVWADICGVLGGMIMSKSTLGIHYVDFIVRFKHEIELKQLIMGLSKAPVFALLIATVGCFQGLRVEGSADSVGVHTTKSVVLSIFLIIVADSIFSVIFSWQGI